MQKESNISFGKYGEELASEYIKANGYLIIERNFRAGKIGEIDIIAKKDEFICFIEVKTRKGTYFGMPSEAVNWKKQTNIKRVAQMFLKLNRMEDFNIRFDIIEVLKKESETAYIDIIEDAF
ncbi:MAG: YraN family protein [Clostridia bacterium]|jgi:putative endonuclease